MISPNAGSRDAPGWLAANSKGNGVAEAPLGRFGCELHCMITAGDDGF
jgi:hypothetical protein